MLNYFASPQGRVEGTACFIRQHCGGVHQRNYAAPETVEGTRGARIEAAGGAPGKSGTRSGRTKVFSQ